MKIRANVCKHIARGALKGRWWSTAMTALLASIFGAFTNLFTGVLKLTVISAIMVFLFERVPFYQELTFLVAFLIAFIWLFVGSFIRLGFIDYNLSILDRRDTSEALLYGSSRIWWDSVELRLLIFLLTGIGLLFFILPGIIIFYNYAMAPFLLEEKKDITVIEAMKLSRQKMKGYRMRFFSLRLSFLGWKILGCLTLGLGFFFITPYYHMAQTVFFNEASGRAEELYGRS